MEDYYKQVKVTRLLDSHHYAARAIGRSHLAMFVGSTIMAGGIAAHTLLPELGKALPSHAPEGGAAIAGMALVMRKGNRWTAREDGEALSALGIMPPQHPGGAFTDIHSGTSYRRPTKENPSWTITVAGQKAPGDSPVR